MSAAAPHPRHLRVTTRTCLQILTNIPCRMGVMGKKSPLVQKHRPVGKSPNLTCQSSSAASPSSFWPLLNLLECALYLSPCVTSHVLCLQHFIYNKGQLPRQIDKCMLEQMWEKLVMAHLTVLSGWTWQWPAFQETGLVEALPSLVWSFQDGPGDHLHSTWWKGERASGSMSRRFLWSGLEVTYLPSTLILLAGTQSYGHTQLQGRLGNVV